ncbi:MAG: hypothetical protein ACF8PN_13290 [Phycisphaerales bacterium]
MGLGRVIWVGLIGAVIMFVWNFLSWVVIPWHNMTMSFIENEEAVVEVMRSEMPERGFYFVPGMSEGPNFDEDAWMERHRQGPIATIAYMPDGVEPMAPKVHAYGFLFYYISTLVGAWMLWMARNSIISFGGRVAFVSAIGIITGAFAHMA